MPKRILVVALLLAAALLVTAQGFVVVGPGEVAVPVLFGAVQPVALGEGPHLADPLASYPRLSVRRQILEMSSGGGADRANAGGEVVSISRNGLALAVDVGFPLALDPTAAPAVYPTTATVSQ